MKITKRGVEKSVVTYLHGKCNGCGCEVECDDNDVDVAAMGDKWYTECPEKFCGEEITLVQSMKGE